jgi:hypothetical protein
MNLRDARAPQLALSEGDRLDRVPGFVLARTW